MPGVFVCDCVRTPIGRYGGTLSTKRADDMAAVPLVASKARNAGVYWAAVEFARREGRRAPATMGVGLGLGVEQGIAVALEAV